METSAVPVLRAVGLSKSFGPVQALRDVSVDAFAGEIHAIVGENGAGKSTLMNLINGSFLPDSGTLVLDAAAVSFANPLAARRAGIGMVHQHFMLVPNFTIAENLALADLESLRGASRVMERAARAAKIAADLNWELDMQARTADLPVGAQQRVEILKVLAGDAKILILDEPTAVLSYDEVEELFRVLRELRSGGRCILLIAHKLSEIIAIADRVTVLRDGKNVLSRPIAEISESEIAHAMTGVDAADLQHSEGVFGDPVLVAEDLTVRGDRGETAVRGVSITIRAGEILGIGGVDGNGQVELAEALAGVRAASSGHVRGIEHTGYISQDRHADGLALSMSILDNLLVGGVGDPGLSKRGWLRWGVIWSWATDLVERFRIRICQLSDPMSSLSGGNQQKVIVSRTLSQSPKALVAVNPTRGLDFQATQFVHEQILAAAARGCAVALFSTDRDELSMISHRTVALSRGEVV